MMFLETVGYRHTGNGMESKYRSVITFRITTTNTYSSDFVGWHISAVGRQHWFPVLHELTTHFQGPD